MTLNPTEQKRIERLKNRKGRKKPAKVPARLTRTSAFAPKRRNLNTDSNFSRLYVVPGHSVIRVKGRELGSQHRDALYALFRLEHTTTTVVASNSPIGREMLHVTRTTWRELLRAMALTEHANNVANLFLTFEELQQVAVTVFEGDQKIIWERLQRGELPDTRMKGQSLLYSVGAEGAALDSEVVITYGRWATDSMTHMRLVSLNADVQFRLKSDYAKSFWPYIDSMNNHTWVDESMLAALAGRELFGEYETAATRRDFRAACRKAFDDMVRAGGLIEWSDEVRGSGRKKTRRYHYCHTLAAQMELDLAVASAEDAQST